MAFLTSVRKRVTRKAGALVEHGQLRMATCFELRKRQMAGWRLIMTPAAIIRNMANSAVLAIERRIFPVNIVLPSRCVRNGHHHLVALHAFLVAHC